METWVYKALNKATRLHQADKIRTLGPLSLALSNITSGHCEKKRSIDSETITMYTSVYKGLQLDDKTVQKYIDKK